MGHIVIFREIFGDFRGGGDFVFSKGKPGSLAQQRCFPYRAILVAIVSQNHV